MGTVEGSRQILEALKEAKIDLVASAPDINLMELINLLYEDGEITHIPVGREEEEGIGVCTGAYMGDFDNTLKGPYVDDLANNFPTQVQNRSQVPDAVTVYRQVQWLWLFCREAGSFF